MGPPGGPGDDTRHAERLAIESIAPFLFRRKHRCTLYTTLEPCMICLGAIIKLGIDAWVIARADPDIVGLRLLPHAAYHDSKRSRLQVLPGYRAAESQALLAAYLRRMGLRRHLGEAAA